MVNQGPTAKPATAVPKVNVSHLRYPAAAATNVSSPSAKQSGAKSSATHPVASGSDVRSSTVKDLQISKPVFVLGSSTQINASGKSSNARSQKASSASHLNGDTSPAVAKPGEPNKRSRLSTNALSISSAYKRGNEKISDPHSKLSASMTSMKVLALSGGTPSKLKSNPVLQSSQLKSSTLTQKGEDNAPLSASSTKSQIGAARPHPRALQLANPQPAQSIDVSRISPVTRQSVKIQSKYSQKLDATPTKSAHTRPNTRTKQGLSLASSSALEGIKASASTTLARRAKASAADSDTEKSSSTRIRKSSALTATPIKARSPPAGSLLRSRNSKEGENRVAASPTGGLLSSTSAAIQHRNFPRQSVDFDAQPEPTAAPVAATPSKPPVPRLNLAAVLTQSQELNLPHHQPDAVVSPTAPSPSTATAQASRHSKASSGSMALGSAPQEDHFYMYKSVTPEERRQWEALIKRLPRTESKQVKKLWDALLDARHNCEGMAFRGHRLLDQMKNDFIAYKQESEKKLAEVEFDRQRLAALLQAKETPGPRKSKRSDTHPARDQSRGAPETETSSADNSPESAKSEGHEDLEYRARIIATSETAHILMKQLMEKEAIQNDLQNQVTDLQKLVYCLANIAKHLLNDQPPRPSAAHLAQWREFVQKLLQQAAYQAASTKATTSSSKPSTTMPSTDTAQQPHPAAQNPMSSSPLDPPPAPRHRSPREETFVPISSTPVYTSTVPPSSYLSPTTSEESEMEFSPTAPEPSAALSPTVPSPVCLSPDIVRQQPFLIHVPGNRKSIGSHILDIDNGPASTAPTSPIDAAASDCSRRASDPDAPSSATLSSPETSIATPSHSEAFESNRAEHAPPAPVFSQRDPMKSPVPPLRLNTLQLRDKLENLDLHSNTDRSACPTAPSSLTTPSSPSQLFYPPLTTVPTPRSPSQREEALRSHIHSLIGNVDNSSQHLLQDNCLADPQPNQTDNSHPSIKLKPVAVSDADVANSRKRKGVAVEDIGSPAPQSALPIIPHPEATSHLSKCPFPQSNPMFNLSTQAETESSSLQGGEEEDVDREVTSLDTSSCDDGRLQSDVKSIVRQACAARSEREVVVSFPQDLKVNTQLSAAQRHALRADHAEHHTGLSVLPKMLSVSGLSPQAHPVAVSEFHNHNFGQQDLIPEAPCLVHTGFSDGASPELADYKRERESDSKHWSRHVMHPGAAAPARTMHAASKVGSAAQAGGVSVGEREGFRRLSQDSTALRAYTNVHGCPTSVGGRVSCEGPSTTMNQQQQPSSAACAMETKEKKSDILQTVAEESYAIKCGSTGLRSFRVSGLQEDRLAPSHGPALLGRSGEREPKSVGMVVGTVTAQTTHMTRLDNLKNDLARLKLSTEARIHDVERLVGSGMKPANAGARLEGREDAIKAEMAVHDNALVMGEESAQLMMLDSCPLELPLPNSMPGFGIASVRLP